MPDAGAGRDGAKALRAAEEPENGRGSFRALLQPGSEPGWARSAGREPVGTALEAFKYVVFKDPNWDWSTDSTPRPTSRARCRGQRRLAAQAIRI